jgi:hypothetical protein
LQIYGESIDGIKKEVGFPVVNKIINFQFNLILNEPITILDWPYFNLSAPMMKSNASFDFLLISDKTCA